MKRPRPPREPELKASVIKEQARLIGHDTGRWYADDVKADEVWIIEELPDPVDLIAAKYWSERWPQLSDGHAVKSQLAYLGDLHESLSLYPNIMAAFATGIREGVTAIVVAHEKRVPLGADDT